MASHTLANIETPYQRNITTNMAFRDKEDHRVIIEEDIKIKNENIDSLAQEDLEKLITHHNIEGKNQIFLDSYTYRKIQRLAKTQALKPTTIDKIGGIFCHICKLTYSRKKEFDEHYARHSCGEVVYACVACYKEYKSYPSFRGHCYTAHVIKERYKCEYCLHYFSKFKALRDHMKAMHTFKCSTCSKQFPSKKELQLHQIIHNKSNAPPYHCQICEVEIASLDSCKEHADIHTVNIYTCPICNENIPSRDNASDHLKNHFDNVDEKLSVEVIQNSDNQETSVERVGGIACGYCSVVSKNRVEFDAHFSYEHGDKDIEYICIICDKKFDKYSMFAQHAYNHRSKDRFCCSICKKPFSRLSMLSTHMAACKADSEASGKPFACSECGHRYVLENSLRKHLLDTHHMHCLTCPVDACQKTFATLKEMILHQNVHNTHQNVHNTHQNLQHWCRQCSLPFLSLASCEQHLDVHKRRLYGCPVCNKNYREKYMLESHIAQHFSSVLLICKTCGKVYDHRRNFADHLKTHNENKVHKCSYCGKGFPKLSRLQEHLNVHTGSKPYKCTICSRTFASYFNWAKHKRRMHNLEGNNNQNNNLHSDNDEIDNPKSAEEEECILNDVNYMNSHASRQMDGWPEINTQVNVSNMQSIDYVYHDSVMDHSDQVPNGTMEPETIDCIDQLQESIAEPETLDRIDQVQDNSLEAEAIIHIDIEKELQILENISESQSNGDVGFVDVLATNETELQILENIPESQNNDHIGFVDMLATNETEIQILGNIPDSQNNGDVGFADVLATNQAELQILENIPESQSNGNVGFADVLATNQTELQILENIPESQSNGNVGFADVLATNQTELQILENIPESQSNGNVGFADVLATNETIFNNAGAPPNTVLSEAPNFPHEYGPEFTIGNSYGFLDLDDHMLPHIDPLLTIKTDEFNMTHSTFIPPDMDVGTYLLDQVTPKWEPPIFTKVCPEYPYSYGDMVDSSRLSMMNTDIF